MLLRFESMPHINFRKSEVMALGSMDLEKERIANMVNCKQETFAFTYLGLPIFDRAITALDWGPLTCKVV
jgi:hypothetical protein